MQILEKKLSNNLIEITPEVLHTILGIATSKGHSFSSEREICNYIKQEYGKDVSEDNIINIFALEREIEDKQICLQYINY